MGGAAQVGRADRVSHFAFILTQGCIEDEQHPFV